MVWRNAVDAAVNSVMVGFKATYGYPPGDNVIEDADRLGASRLVDAGAATPADLLTLYAAVGAVSLPDIGNGLFLHSPQHVAYSYATHEPRRVTGRYRADV